MFFEGIMLSEIWQAEKNKYVMISLIHEIQKMKQTNQYTKKKQTHIQRPNFKVTVRRGERGRVIQGYRMKRYKLLCIR